MKKIDYVAVDLDGTLAHYEKFEGPTVIGPPIPLMIATVKRLLEKGIEVKIFTARLSDESVSREEIISAIQNWCEENIGVRLDVTNVKDYNVSMFFDDRALQVIKNEGVMAVDRAWEDGFKAGFDAAINAAMNKIEDVDSDDNL